MTPTEGFLQARDLLIELGSDYKTAYERFRWPRLDPFNWALDYFDIIAKNNNQIALRLSGEQGLSEISFSQLAECSSRVANYFRRIGIRRGDRVLVLLPNVVALWEIMLAAMKVGAVVSPAAPLLSVPELSDRIERGEIRHLITDAACIDKCAALPARLTRLVVDERITGWLSYADADGHSKHFEADGPIGPGDPLLLYFTSGTTAKPKMVLHTHLSYPVGHLSTMFWIGLRQGDIHFNISSPGWAKHAWSSFFAPWNAEATVFVLNKARFDARKTLAAIVDDGVTTLCAPPTVWRMFILEDLASFPVKLREAVSAGEPLNPEVIERVRDAWGLTIRDGYGQTETTALVGNSPGQDVKVGSMGRPLPGYRISLIDDAGARAEEGQIVIELGEPNTDVSSRPAGLMAGYVDGTYVEGVNVYRTSDAATRDGDGYFWFVGRADDVFKSSDYRISPFEIESALLEHEAVSEAAVVPSPDAVRLCVPKAFIVLKPGFAPTEAVALSIFRFVRQRLAPYQRVRRLEFAELPKTISGKIRRVELRQRELLHADKQEPRANEFWEETFAEQLGKRKG